MVERIQVAAVNAPDGAELRVPSDPATRSWRPACDTYVFSPYSGTWVPLWIRTTTSGATSA